MKRDAFDFDAQKKTLPEKQESCFPSSRFEPRRSMETDFMKVVTIAAPKGGSAKTTTAALLAVRATQDGQNVCLMDPGRRSAQGANRSGLGER